MTWGSGPGPDPVFMKWWEWIPILFVAGIFVALTVLGGVQVFVEANGL